MANEIKKDKAQENEQINERNDELIKVKQKLARNNYIWVICLLSACIIIIAAITVVFWLFDKEYVRLLSILDIVSTLLAIILSIFSILYSYNTSIDASKALSSVTTEVIKIERTNTNLEKHLGIILDRLGNNSHLAESKKESEIGAVPDSMRNKI